MRRLLVPLLAAVLLVTGCRSEPSAAGSVTGDTKGYVAGNGETAIYPKADRKPAPQVEGSTLDGARFDLAAARGHVVVMSFWASWCAPCRAEAADLEAAYESTRDSGVTFVGVNTRDQHDSANQFVTAYRITYPSLFDPQGRVALRFSQVPPTAFPATLILDKDGKVAVLILTTVSRDGLTSLLKQIGTET